MLYTYGLCPPLATDVIWPRGISGLVQWVGGAQLGAIVETEVAMEQLLQDDQRLQQAILAHDRVLTTLFDHTPILPLSFGTRLASEAALQQHLIEQGDRYLEQLAQIGDRAEFLIKIVPIVPPPAGDTAPPPSPSGRDYFQAKKARLQTQTAQQHQRQAQFEHLYQAICDRYPDVAHTPTEDGIERVYVLAARSAIPTLQALLTHVFKPWPEPLWGLSLSPPLPPYHFV